MVRVEGRSGFTLLELIMIASLIAITAAIGSPKLSAAMRDRSAHLAADQFASAHSLARATAIRYGRVAQLHINASAKRFWIDIDTTSARSGSRATMWYVRDLSQTGVVMSSNRSLLCFDGRGLPLVGGGCEPGDATIIFTMGDKADTLVTASLGKILR